MSIKDTPLVSIITVSFNSSKTIEKTILSVINQTYKNIEYIIIDGSSTDGTLDIINKFKDRISYFISEKDGGIYDAMNKGSIVAHGKYLNFMNSDDYFFSDSVIEECAQYLDGINDIVYGNTEVRHEEFRSDKIQINNLPKDLWKKPVNHQSSFIKRETMLKYGYNITNKIIADYEFFLNVYYKNGKIIKINKTIASYYGGGYSGVNKKQSIKDWYKTIKKFDHRFTIKLWYIWRKLDILHSITKVLKKMLRPKLYFSIKKYTLDKISNH